MRIRVDEIPESGRTLRFHWDEERLNQFIPPGDPLRVKLLRPINVVLTVQRRADHIRITGTIEGTFELVCHRCLQPFAHFLNEEVDVYLIEEKRAPEADEKELEAEELKYEFFTGEIIEVDRLVAEQIFLALPVKVLCSEGCKGICPRCGANWNEESCRCEGGSTESPFAKLERIKSGLPDSGDA